jgi:conjugative transfer signal peptidase TraF
MRDAIRGGIGYKTWLGITVISVAFMAVSGTEILPKRIIWNASPSVAIGLYWVKNGVPKLGDIVLVELPEPIEILSHQRGYLPKNIPALKRIRAVSGDTVCRFKRRVFINGTVVAVAQLNDFRGLKLPDWQGCKTLKPDEVFLLTDHPKSFDGRYFGPIKREFILGIAVPVWTD